MKKNVRTTFFLFLFFFLCMAACASNIDPQTSTAVEPAAVDEKGENQGVLEEANQTDEEKELLPIVFIKNANSGEYLYEVDEQAKMTAFQSTAAFQWQIENYQGSKRIRNVESGNYLSIENLQAYVEVIPIEAEWMSPRWTFETVGNAIVIRNVWHTWQVLYQEGVQMKYDRYSKTDSLDQWIIEPMDGNVFTNEYEFEPVTVPVSTRSIDERGADVPWIEYEAEETETNGETLQPDRTFGTFAAESSGRSAVKLSGAGMYIQFTSQEQANSIVIRYIIPDSEDGGGLDATISLYVDGSFRQKINLTSRYAWSYGGEEFTFNTPAAGGAHHFYDEARALVGDIPEGASVILQIDQDDTAEYYVIDLIDLELVPEPLTMPEGYLSITDFGAIANNGQDDGDAIRKTIAEAKKQGKGVWIPEGTFESMTAPFEISDVTIQGAGMWYSVIHGQYARFNCVGNNCRFNEFAILGETILRDDKIPENGFNGGAGTGSIMENVWVEHTKVGWWVGPGSTNGLIIRNCRFRNLYADGVNFCNGTSNSLIENTHFRNTGDDAMASWSPSSTGVNMNNVFRYNTIQVPWRANCIAIYGGEDNKVQNNLCFDVVTYPGILIAQQFNSNSFAGETLVQRNSLIRTGGPMFNDQHGAFKVWADQGDILGLVVEDLLIEDSTFTGIDLEGSYGILDSKFSNIVIRNSGTDAIYLRSNLNGAVEFEQVIVENPGREALKNNAPKLKFDLIKGSDNTGW